MTQNSSWQQQAIARLDQLHHHRGRGFPALATLIGEPLAASTLWTEWNAHAGRSVVVWSAAANASYLTLWLEQLFRDCNPCTALSTVPAPAKRRLGLWWAKPAEPQSPLLAFAAHDPYLSQFVHWLLAQCADGAALSLAATNTLLAKLMEDDALLPAQVLALLTRCFGEAPLPALLFAAAADQSADNTPELAARLAESAPALVTAVSVSETQWEHYQRQARESRYKALLQQGLVHLPTIPSLTAPAVAMPDRWAALTTLAGDRGQQLVATLRRYDAEAALIEQASDLLRLLPTANRDPQTTKQVRSQAEQLLFALFALTPDLAGQFQRNVALPLTFGNRPLEVDLLADPPGVAIEIDGDYHVTAADCYRRDRRKDWLLQQHGLIVLRFLAEDVVSHLESLLETVRAALQCAQS